MITQPTTSQPQLDDFRAHLDAIVKGYGDTQRALTLVFRACLRDLFHSKSVDRLNLAARSLAGLPIWGEFCKRIRLAYGGSEFDAEKVYDVNALSAVHYVKKFNGFIRQDMSPESYKAHLAFFDSKLSTMDWNAFKYSRKAAPQVVTCKSLKAAYLQIRDNRAAWHADERAQLERVLTALTGIFD